MDDRAARGVLPDEPSLGTVELACWHRGEGNREHLTGLSSSVAGQAFHDFDRLADVLGPVVKGEPVDPGAAPQVADEDGKRASICDIESSEVKVNYGVSPLSGTSPTAGMPDQQVATRSRHVRIREALGCRHLTRF